MSMITRWLDIRDYEISSCFWFSLLNFLMMAGIFLGRAARDSLFFINVGAEKLPMVFIFNAVVLTIISLYFSSVSGKYVKKRHRFFSTNFVVFAFAILVFVYLLNYSTNSEYHYIIYWIFFIFCEITLFVMMRLFWFFSEDYFTEQQMKRLSPKFVGSGQIGIALGGILTLVFVEYFGTEKIVIIWLILVMTALAISWHILKSIKPLQVEIKEPDPTEKSSIFDGLKIINKSRYLRLFVFITACVFIISSIFDVSLAYTAQKEFGNNADKLTEGLGLITIFFGFFASIIQFFFMSKIIRRLGVGWANMFSPICLTIGSIILFFWFTFYGTAASRIFFLFNEYLFNQSIIVLLYSAVREEERGKVSFFIEGSVVNIAIGVAGVALMLYSMFLPMNKLGWAALGFGLAMLGASYFLIAEYKKILVENLGAKPPEDRNLMLKNALGLKDKNSDKLINDCLSSKDETTVIVAMNLITQEKKDESDKERKRSYLDISLKRVNDENRNIRLSAIRMIIELTRDEDFKEEYLRTVTEKILRRVEPGNIELVYSDRDTINALLDIYMAWGTGYTGEFEALSTYLSKIDDKEIVGDLIIHLKDMGFMGIYNGIKMLNELIVSKNPVDLTVANRVLGEYGEEAFHKDLTDICNKKLEKINLVKVMGDDLEQLQEIIKAFGKIDYKNDKKAREAFHLLIECLREPVLRRNAVKSLEKLMEKKPFLFSEFIKSYEGGWRIEIKREMPWIVKSIKPQVMGK